MLDSAVVGCGWGGERHGDGDGTRDGTTKGIGDGSVSVVHLIPYCLLTLLTPPSCVPLCFEPPILCEGCGVLSSGGSIGN